jgi:hypothetical protein
LENAHKAEPYLVVHGWINYALQEIAYLYDELIEVMDGKLEILTCLPNLIAPRHHGRGNTGAPKKVVLQSASYRHFGWQLLS